MAPSNRSLFYDHQALCRDIVPSDHAKEISAIPELDFPRISGQ
jgi:hypothetical protein